jgi:hypothetical protein
MGLFSSSSSKSTSTTQNYDQRVIADAGALAIGAGGSYTINQPFSDQVRDAYLALVNLAGKSAERESTAMQTAVSMAAAQATATLSQLDRTQKGASTIYTDLFPFIAVGAVVIGIAIFMRGR